MTSTIRDLTELTAVAPDDYLLISDTSDVTNRDKKISKLNLVGGAISGGGALATGGFTLTVPATGTAALKSGTPAAGRVASWLDGNTVQDGGFALTDVARLSTVQSFSALKTFSAGLNLGQTTLTIYEEGTWTPVVADAASGGNLAGGTFSGQYQRIGGVVTAWAQLVDIVTTSMTGANPIFIRGLPYPARTITNYTAIGAANFSRFNFTLFVVPQVTSALSYVTFAQMVNGGASTFLTVAAIASSGVSDAYLSISYLV